MGYGDIAPVSVAEKILASIVIIMGYAIIAVPTGIVTSEFQSAKLNVKEISSCSCPDCFSEEHDKNAQFCKICGTELHPNKKHS